MISLHTSIKVPESIRVNDIVYYFADADTPDKAVAYMALLQYVLNRQEGVIV